MWSYDQTCDHVTRHVGDQTWSCDQICDRVTRRVIMHWSSVIHAHLHVFCFTGLTPLAKNFIIGERRVKASCTIVVDSYPDKQVGQSCFYGNLAVDNYYVYDKDIDRDVPWKRRNERATLRRLWTWVCACAILNTIRYTMNRVDK